ncbi:MAG: PAS domain S-box protein, partial [Saprospiraceae bacterium]|nr:PAS domain S-box protein [Saprospiraceae bacterium]
MRPDIVLMDIVMPGLIDGIDAAEIIKAELDIPIIFLTAYADQRVIDKAKTVEPFGYMIKPFQEMEIKASIEVALYKKDIERKLRKSEESLRESEEKLRLFVEYAPAALAMFDREMRYVAVSRRWMTDYQLGDQNIIGRSHYEVFPEIPDRWKTAHRRGLAGEIVQTEEDNFIHQDGTIHFLQWEIRSWHKADTSIGGLVIFTEDITKRKQADAALANAKKQWEETFDAVLDWVIITDKNHTIIRSNKASESFVNLSPKQIIGKRCHEVVHGIDCPKPDCPAERDAKSKQRETKEIQLESGRWIEVSVDPIQNKNNVDLFVHTVRDITDRKNLEAQKDKLEAQKRQIHKAESLGRMAGAIAHNFNNQLQVVIGNLEMAMDDQPGGSDALSEALIAAR